MIRRRSFAARVTFGMALCSSLMSSVIAQVAPAPESTAESDVEARIKNEVAIQVKQEVAIQLARQAELAEEKHWKVGITPNGGGAFIASPDGQSSFRIYTYAQSVFTATDKGNQQVSGATDFRINRARLDFLADFAERYRLFIETEAASNPGGALIEAYGQAAYVKDLHYVRFGKYVSPFSTENLRTSRGIPLVNRFIALNSLFSLPAIDCQFGPMLFGYFGDQKQLNYNIGVFNGNASAGNATVSGQGGNVRDNNSTKEVQVRVNYSFSKQLTVGAAVDIDKEEAQTLQISSFSGARLLAVPVQGKRFGMDMDAHWVNGRAAVDTEWITAEFSDNPNNMNREVTLRGGYVQYSYWLSGSESGGWQGVLRGETAELSGDAANGIDGNRITALTIGTNIWFGGSTRLQLNAIGEHVNGNGNGSFTGGSRIRPTFQAELQVKL